MSTTSVSRMGVGRRPERLNSRPMFCSALGGDEVVGSPVCPVMSRLNRAFRSSLWSENRAVTRSRLVLTLRISRAEKSPCAWRSSSSCSRSSGLLMEASTTASMISKAISTATSMTTRTSRKTSRNCLSTKALSTSTTMSPTTVLRVRIGKVKAFLAKLVDEAFELRSRVTSKVSIPAGVRAARETTVPSDERMASLATSGKVSRTFLRYFSVPLSSSSGMPRSSACWMSPRTSLPINRERLLSSGSIAVSKARMVTIPSTPAAITISTAAWNASRRAANRPGDAVAAAITNAFPPHARGAPGCDRRPRSVPPPLAVGG